MKTKVKIVCRVEEADKVDAHPEEQKKTEQSEAHMKKADEVIATLEELKENEVK